MTVVTDSCTFLGQGKYFNHNTGELVIREIARYAHRCAKATAMLLTLLQVTSGMPARATELQSLAIKNLPTSPRSIFMSHGIVFDLFFFALGLILFTYPFSFPPFSSLPDTLMFAPVYSKTDNLTGKQKKICRFLHPEVALVAFTLLTFIKPLEAIFVGKLAVGNRELLILEPGPADVDDEDDEDNDETDEDDAAPAAAAPAAAAPAAAAPAPKPCQNTLFFLFTKLGRRMSSDAIRDTFSSTLAEHGAFFLKFSQYRDLAIAYERINRRHNDANAKLSLMIALQGGHSETTEDEVYGREAGEHLNHGADWEWSFLQVSISWQSLLFARFASYFIILLGECCLPIEPSPTSFSQPPKSVDPWTGVPGPIRRVREPNAGAAAPLQPHPHPHPHPHPQPHPQVQPPLETDFPLPSQLDDLKGAIARVLQKPVAQVVVSEQQLGAVHTVANTKRDLLLCLATGAGKTMAYMAPTLLPTYRGTTVVIVPLRALHTDVTERAQALGNGAISWTGNAPTTYPPIIIVSSEKAIGNPFLAYLTHLDATEKLTRIVYDEVHLFLTSQYRQSLRSVLTFTGKYRCPHLYLSATMPAELESALRHELGGSTFITIRGPSQRPNLEYRVATKKTSREMEEFLMEQVTSKFSRFDPADRMIIFCFSIADTKAVQALLSPDLRVGIYSGEMETREKDNALRSWKAGDLPIMVATSGFGVGIDYPRVKDVIIYGACHDLLSYSQLGGRAGRDRSITASVTTITSYAWQARYRNIGPDFKSMLRMINNTTQCRRTALETFLDGKPVPCCLASGVTLCDVCQSK